MVRWDGGAAVLHSPASEEGVFSTFIRVRVFYPLKTTQQPPYSLLKMAPLYMRSAASEEEDAELLLAELPLFCDPAQVDLVSSRLVSSRLVSS
jgi:hypothetical protein